MSDVYLKSVAVMDTVVTIQVCGRERDCAQRVEAALEWFLRIEACCSRFDEASEVRQLDAHVGDAVRVSDTLFEAVQFALAVAEESGGAFDPTVGRRMELRGFDREHRTGRRTHTRFEESAAVSYRDVSVDPEHRTITLRQPLVLDLGAVAKGLAVDMAARELAPLGDFAVDAGGDLYVAGHNPHGVPWSVGIRHPRLDDRAIETIAVSGAAVCTSGDYARRAPTDGASHHIIDPRTGASTCALASVTVVAPTALVADALATAAFVLGPVHGAALLERHGVDALLLTPALERRIVSGSYHCFQA